MPGGVRFELGIIKPCRKRDRQPGKPICLYSKSKPRKLLGRHKTYLAALKQERAIQIRKRMKRG